MKNKQKTLEKAYIPQAIFNQAKFLKFALRPVHVSKKFNQDFQYAKQFLLSYQHNEATFNSFRREIERYVQYCWFIADKPTTKMKRIDIEEYLTFCQKPPTAWVGLKNVNRFILKEGQEVPNKEWRPFVASVSKSENQEGLKPKRREYQLSEKGFREIFTILNCYYNFLIQEEFAEINPILQIKQKNRFYRSYQSKQKIRRVSSFQWQTIIETAEEMASQNPDKHERTLFIMSCLYGMYLRISELAASQRWIPKMNDFEKDHEGNWWFVTVGKGNKERRIAVSPAMLLVLKRWRKHLGLTPALPSPNDNSPLIPKSKGQGPITDTRYIRRIVQGCFDETIKKFQKQGLENDAQELGQATVHWLRHTGISEDVKIRPREHVRDDAGHSSSSITDKYIDITLKERHKSARKKIINPTLSITQKES